MQHRAAADSVVVSTIQISVYLSLSYGGDARFNSLVNGIAVVKSD
jgi:hypothetical protein